MSRDRVILTVFTLFLSAVWIAPVQAEIRYYRYKDENGTMVLNNQLPPHIAPKGYEIVNHRGNVIEVVAPEKSKAEIEKAKREAKLKAEQERQRQKEKAALEHEKQILLNAFSSTEDIIRLRNSKVEAIDNHISVTRDYIERIVKRQNRLEERAANYERSGKDIPKKLSKSLYEIRRQLQEHHQFIASKEIEKKQIRSDFDADIAKFKKYKEQERRDKLRRMLQ